MDNKQNHQDWDNLPVPDAEQSWQKMEAMLDKDDDDRVPPPLFFRTCAGWGVFGIAVLIGLWFILDPTGMWSNIQTAEKERTVTSKNELLQQTQEDKTPTTNKSNTSDTSRNRTKENQRTQTTTTRNENFDNNKISNISKRNSVNNHLAATRKVTQTKLNKTKGTGSSKENIAKRKSKKDNESNAVVITNPPLGIRGIASSIDNPEMPTGMYPVDHNVKTTPEDTTQKEVSKQDTSLKTENSLPEENKKQEKKKLFYLTVGVGLQQQIPVAGQSGFPYNYYGRKGSLSDYIPSAYVRFHKANKWFVQAEFRYGAPQSVKNFSYSKQTVYDTSTHSLTTTSLYLRKTYYHQIPLSFNYYVRPNWSVGLGGVYSRFYGAVTEEEIRSKNVFTQTEKVSRKIVQVPEYNDSFLYKTQVHFLIQTEYQWKRFSFGLRYKKDIQPYIKYTQPDGVVDVKKNQSMEAIVRFRLWQSGKF